MISDCGIGNGSTVLIFNPHSAFAIPHSLDRERIAGIELLKFHQDLVDAVRMGWPS